MLNVRRNMYSDMLFSLAEPTPIALRARLIHINAPLLPCVYQIHPDFHVLLFASC